MTTRNLSILILALMLAPLASAGVASFTREYVGAGAATWESGRQNDVPSSVHTSTISLSVAIGTCVTNCGAQVNVKPGCTGSTVNLYTLISGITAGEREPMEFTVLGGDCFWINATGSGGTPDLPSPFVWINSTLSDYEGQAHANVTRLEMNATRTAQNDIQNQTRTDQNDIQNATRIAVDADQNATRTAQNDIQNASIALKCDRGTDPDLACVGNRYANGTFEGQAHANATWCDKLSVECLTRAEADTIYEGQVHANATWCPVPTCDPPTTGGFVSNLWFNETWRWNPILGNVSALSLTVGWTNTTELDVLGNVTLVTDADPYLPILIWGGIAVFFFYYVAWLPAIASLAAMGNALLPSPPFSLATSALLVAVCIGIHVAVMRDIRPAMWGRKERIDNKEG